MALIILPVFDLRHEFLRLIEKNSMKGSKFNYTPDSISFHEDLYRFIHTGAAPGCSQWMYYTTGKTCGNGDHPYDNRCYDRSSHRNKYPGADNRINTCRSPDDCSHGNSGANAEYYTRVLQDKYNPYPKQHVCSCRADRSSRYRDNMGQ
jgi:hypothetical protein